MRFVFLFNCLLIIDKIFIVIDFNLYIFFILIKLLNVIKYINILLINVIIKRGLIFVMCFYLFFLRYIIILRFVF